MGSGFAGDAHLEPSALGGADGIEGAGGGDVLDVEVRAEVFAQLDVAQELDVALDDAGLGFDGHATESKAEGDWAGVDAGAGTVVSVLGMLGDGHAEAGA